jgi:hypothetical protein
MISSGCQSLLWANGPPQSPPSPTPPYPLPTGRPPPRQGCQRTTGSWPSPSPWARNTGIEYEDVGPVLTRERFNFSSLPQLCLKLFDRAIDLGNAAAEIDVCRNVGISSPKRFIRFC